MYTLEGVSNVANFITAYEESQENRDSHFLICSVFFVSKGNLFDVYYNSTNGAIFPPISRSKAHSPVSRIISL